MEPTYLVDAGEERESMAAWRLFTGPCCGHWMRNLGIDWPAGWALLRVKTDPQEGEIDVLAGRLNSVPSLPGQNNRERELWYLKQATDGHRFFATEDNKLSFDFSYIVGLEIKCAFVAGKGRADGLKEPVLKSQKNGARKEQRLEHQLRRLLKLGLDKVFLLDVVAGIPCEATTLGDVFSWTALSVSTAQREHARMKEGFAKDLPIGQLAIVLGPNRGSTEDKGGFHHFEFGQLLTTLIATTQRLSRTENN